MIATLLITATTVLRHRSDIHIPRIAASEAVMISTARPAGESAAASGKTIQRKRGSFQSPKRWAMSHMTNTPTVATGTATSGSTKLTSPRSFPQM